jgi:hypothetical protein
MGASLQGRLSHKLLDNRNDKVSCVISGQALMIGLILTFVPVSPVADSLDQNPVNLFT